MRYVTLAGKPEGAAERALAGGREEEAACGPRELPCSVVSGGEYCRLIVNTHLCHAAASEPRDEKRIKQK